RAVAVPVACPAKGGGVVGRSNRVGSKRKGLRARGSGLVAHRYRFLARGDGEISQRSGIHAAGAGELAERGGTCLCGITVRPDRGGVISAGVSCTSECDRPATLGLCRSAERGRFRAAGDGGFTGVDVTIAVLVVPAAHRGAVRARRQR